MSGLSLWNVGSARNGLQGAITTSGRVYRASRNLRNAYGDAKAVIFLWAGEVWHDLCLILYAKRRQIMLCDREIGIASSKMLTPARCPECQSQL